MEKLDRKFTGVIVKNKNQSIVPDDRWIVFLVTDNAVPGMLEAYAEECKELGVAGDQMIAIKELMGRVEYWRAKNPDQCKIPDLAPGELLQ